MNGAQALIRTLVDSGVDTCFMNPGTSEMHFVSALDTVPEMRGVLALFEGVATGAADGYGRMAGRPAASLLHLGSGLGNGVANLHNARRAHTPLVNIVGDHATYHLQYDAPLTSDIASIAAAVSPGWQRTSTRTEDVGADTAAAVAAAYGPPGQVATLILPADVSWGDGGVPAAPAPVPTPAAVDASTVEAVAKVLRSGESAALILGGATLREAGLRAASRVAAATGAKVLAETFPARLERGAGVPPIERLGYLAEFMQMQLQGVQHLVLVEASAPVSFFAYPGKPSELTPDGAQVHGLAGVADDGSAALAALAETLGAGGEAPSVQDLVRPAMPTGALAAESAAAIVGALLPEGAIVSDESNTASLFLPPNTAGAPRHDWLTLTGGAIGQGMPVATGAAVACPDRKVLCLQAEGSAMYTLQSLWTQAREGLDVTTVIYNNRSYAILNVELGRVGAEPGPRAKAMFDLAQPALDFVALARGMGVDAARADTCEDFAAALERAITEPGPSLVEAVIPSFTL